MIRSEVLRSARGKTVAWFFRIGLATIATIGSLLAPLPGEQRLESDGTNRDYRAELPRIPPTPPDEALRSFQLVDGFRIELVAAEPLVVDPVAMAFDEFGRLYVVEMRCYSEQGEEHLGVVRRLIDSNDDGIYDTGTDFVTQLSWPTAIACYNGGVLIGAAPDIYFCRDHDGNGVADERRVAFTGFGRDNVQGLLNSFIWGVDNWLYGATSSSGGKVIAAGEGGTPLDLNRQDFAIHPQTLEMKAVAGGAQHGMSFDKWGTRYASSNSDHIQMYTYDPQYLRRNPELKGVTIRQSIAADGPAAEVYRTSPPEPWRVVRTRLRVKGLVEGPVEGGGRAAGYFTGATGVTIYQGDAFPDEFQRQTMAVVGDVGSNLVHLKRIEEVGLHVEAHRVHPGREFLTSTDNWFRPVQFANGPDGALYVLDMYREVIEHPLSLPPMIKKHLDLTSGRDRGRIYRIVPRDYQRSPRPYPGQVDERGLVEMLSHTNGWHRETAARILVQRFANEPAGERANIVSLLAEHAHHGVRPEGRMRALYGLASLNHLNRNVLERALQDTEPRVRQHAIRLTESLAPADKLAIADRLLRLTADPDLHVRQQLAFTLGEYAESVCLQGLSAMASSGFDEDPLRIAILSSLRDLRVPFLREQLQRVDSISSRSDAKLSPPPRTRPPTTGVEPSAEPNKHERSIEQSIEQLIEQIIGQIGAANQPQEQMAALLLWQNAEPNQRIRRDAQLLLSMNKRGKGLIAHLRSLGIEGPEARLMNIVDVARMTLADQDRSHADRIDAIQHLGLAEWSLVADDLADLLKLSVDPVLSQTAVDVVGSFSDPAAAALLVSHLDDLSAGVRFRGTEILLSRPASTQLLLDDLQEQGTAARLAASHRQQLLRHLDDSIRERAVQLLGRSEDRDRILESYQGVLEESGDAERGRLLFRKACTNCHRLEDEGHGVGPDLQPLRGRGAAFMLTNILAPNRELDRRYESYLVVTTEGEGLTGIISEETSQEIELRQAGGKSIRLPRNNIEHMTPSGQSLMPEGLEKELNRQDLVDLIAYLVAE